MQKLFGVPIDQLMIVLVAIFALGVLVFVIAALRNRVVFKLAVRNIPRRKTQTGLIILGLMLATLLFSAAFATGDTLTNSIRHQALSEIGQTDVIVRTEGAAATPTAPGSMETPDYFSEDVAVEVQDALSGIAEVEAVVPALRESLPAFSPDGGLSEPQLAVTGLPSEGPQVGRLEAADGSALQVAELTEDQAYVSAQAAENLDVALGDEIQVFAGPQPRSFTVAGIYDQGEHPAGTVSMVVTLPVAQDLLGADGRLNRVLISNEGDAVQGARHTDMVVSTLEPIFAETDLEVAPVKQDALDEADEAGASFSTIFILFAQFSVAAGVLLIFLIFVMLAAERKHEMGIARAVGAQRGHVIRVFTFEGAIYAVLAAAVGSLLGVAVGYAMVFILQAAFSQIAESNGSLELTFAFNWKSVVIAYTLGVVLTFFVVIVSSWRVSRLNIVRAVRDIPEPRIQQRSWKNLAMGIALPLIGILLAASGLQSAQYGPFSLGVSLVIIGLPLLARRFGLPERVAFTAAGAGLLAFWLMPASVLESFLPEMEQGIEMFFISGIMLVIGGVWVVIFNSQLLLSLVVSVFGRIKGAPPVLKTAVAYPMQSRFRTGMTLAMFSLVVFTLVVMSFITAALGQVFSNEEGLSGGYEVRATSGLLSPIEDIRAEIAAANQGEPGTTLDPEDFTAIGSVALSLLEARPSDAEIEAEEIGLQGADQGYLDSVGYGFALTASGYESDRAVWQGLTEPDTVVVSAALVPTRADFSQGAPQPPFRFDGFYVQDDVLPDDVMLTVTDPATGGSRELRVIGVMETLAIYTGMAITSQDTLAGIVGEPVPPSSFWFQTAADRDPEVVARTLERTFLASGMQAVSTSQEIKEFSSANIMINQLLQGFMALGLVVGIAALGVIAARSVVERRQQIGVLRAIGFQREMVRNSFLLESSFIALLGIGLGLVLGFALSPQIVSAMAEDFDGLQIVFPWGTTLIVVAVAYVAALVTTLYPARQAAAIYPAEALRYE